MASHQSVAKSQLEKSTREMWKEASGWFRHEAHYKNWFRHKVSICLSRYTHFMSAPNESKANRRVFGMRVKTKCLPKSHLHASKHVRQTIAFFGFLKVQKQKYQSNAYDVMRMTFNQYRVRACIHNATTTASTALTRKQNKHRKWIVFSQMGHRFSEYEIKRREKRKNAEK